MQKRILKSAVSVLALSAASIAIMPMTVSFAETITYDGTATDANNSLKYEFFQDNNPNTTWYSIYPGSFSQPGTTENIINVGNSTALSTDDYNAPHRVYGGFTEAVGVAITNNKVFVSGGLISNDVYGGRGTQVVTGNSVDLSGGWVLGSIYGAWSDNTVNSLNNTVNITGGQMNGAVYGAFAASDTNGNVSGNKVTVTGAGAEAWFVIGAEAMGDGELNVSGNSVAISEGATAGRVFGGANSSNGLVTGNSVTVSTGATAETIYGGSTFGIGNVSGNSASVDNASVTEAVYGGQSDGIGAVSDNHVSIVAGAVVNKVMGGVSDSSGTVSLNRVTFTNSTASAQVFGGWSFNGDANENVVSITNGTVTTDLAGGYVSDVGSANGNKVVISGTSQIKGMTLGAYIESGTGTATGNSVQINGGIIGSEVASNIVSEINGGRAAAGDSVSNSVTMTGGVAQRLIYGGTTVDGNAISNSVTITGGVAKLAIYGGSSTNGTAKNNIASISNATVGGVTGGSGKILSSRNEVHIENANVGNLVIGGVSIGSDSVSEYNSVSISKDTKVTQSISGGHSQSGKALSNSVSISDSKVDQSVFGGYVDGGVANNSAANNNSVEIVNSTILGKISAGIMAGSDIAIGRGDVISNKLTVTGSTVARDVVGGWTDIGLAKLNDVAVSNSTLGKSVIGGYIDQGVGNVEQNSITLTNNTKVAEKAIGGYTASGNATGNSVSITDSTVSQNVYGGYSANGDAINNTVSLNGTNVNIAGFVYGGFSVNQSGDQFTGNTLNLKGYRGSVASIYNVQNYNWLLPKDVVNNDVLVHVTGAAVDLNNTNHTVTIENDGNRLNTNDQIVMIDNATGVPTATPTQVQQGQFIIYEVNMRVDENNKFVLNVADKKDETPAEGGGETGGGNTGGETGGETGGGNTGGETSGRNTGGGNSSGSNAGSVIEEATRPSVTPAGRINPRTKAYSEGRVGALAFVNQAGDGIASEGIQSALAAIDAQGSNGQNFTVAPFMVLKGSSQRYNTGSHVDIDGFNMVIGLAGATQVEAGHKIMFGAFYEYGHGTYKTYNGFDNLASVRGDGETDYNGGGVFGRIEFAGTGLGRVTNLANTQTDGLYLDASLRGGKTKLEFDSNDLYDGEGYRGHYNSKASYIGAHGTLGYVFNFDEKQALDVYSRYLWTRVNGDNVVIGKDTLRFERSTSSRIQLGGRYNYTYSQQFIPYVGLAYEHEFKGTVSANAYGLALGEPSLQGDSGIVEAGFMVRPIATAPDLSVNIGGQGFFGRREGGAGSLKVKYQF